MYIMQKFCVCVRERARVRVRMQISIYLICFVVALVFSRSCLVVTIDQELKNVILRFCTSPTSSIGSAPVTYHFKFEDDGKQSKREYDATFL